MARRPFQKNNRRRPAKSPKSASSLPKNAPMINVTISHIGSRGDGVGTADFTHNYQTKPYQIFVPHTLVGEEVVIQPTSLTGQGISGDLRELVTSSADRKAPDCDASPACGGCQFQHMAQTAYRAWKTDMLSHTLAKASLAPARWRTPFFATNQQRRRARLAIRRRKDDALIGFRERGSHQIIFPASCAILETQILAMVAILRDDLLLCLEDGATGEVDITLCDNGCDITLLPDQDWPLSVTTALTMRAGAYEIARLTLQTHKHGGELLFSQQTPQMTWQLPQTATANSLTLHPAPNSFLQADKQAEAQMQKDIFEALSGCNHILDLFAGSGSLSAPLLFAHPRPDRICAFDTVKEALAAFDEMADANGLSMQLTTTQRNLFHAPLTPAELDGFDAAIIDPPRAGAIAQMPALAQSGISTIIMVSCNPHSFARDCATLTQGGYHFDWIRLIDQFKATSHCEVIACFTKKDT